MGLVLTDKQDAEMSRLLSHMAAVRDNWPSIVWLKDALRDDDKWSFLEVWESLGKDPEKTRAIQISLWHATTKGGIWTTAERNKMREFWRP